MPTKPKRYRTQIPKLQFQILREIALAGDLSNSKLKERLQVTHPVISDAIKVLEQRKLVKVSHTEKAGSKGGKPEKYYALTKGGMDQFIKRNPSPEEFFQALLRSYTLRPQSGWLHDNKMSSEDFELHYKSFEQNYLGYASNHGYLVQSPFFNKLYEQWLAEYHPALFGQSHLKKITRQIHSPFFEECYNESLRISDLNGYTVDQKVLECLAIHRSITEKQIEELLNSKQKLIAEKLAGKTNKAPDFIQNQVKFHYAITPVNVRRVIDKYTLSESYIQDKLQKFEDVDYDNVIKKYVEYLSHLVIIKINSSEGFKYELSLFGAILILAIVTHPGQKMFYKDNGMAKDDDDLAEFYSKVSQNYADKIPLIFGKWPILVKASHDAYRWFFPILYQNLEDEFARFTRPGSVSVTLGGVKEYKDTIQEIAFHTTSRLFDLYRGLLSVITNNDQELETEHKEDDSIAENRDRQLLHQAGLSILEKKQKELAALLKYADLNKFIQKLKSNKTSVRFDQQLESIYNSELPIMEKALASEITSLFYINLARNRFLDYTDEGRHFLGDERDTGYKDTSEYHILKPIDFLRIILKSDKELKNTFLSWMADIRDYRRRSTEYMEQFEMTVRKWKNQPN
jgi:DNA-binding MarR family transcriptional regulator